MRALVFSLLTVANSANAVDCKTIYSTLAKTTDTPATLKRKMLMDQLNTLANVIKEADPKNSISVQIIQTANIVAGRDVLLLPENLSTHLERRLEVYKKSPDLPQQKKLVEALETTLGLFKAGKAYTFKTFVKHLHTVPDIPLTKQATEFLFTDGRILKHPPTLKKISKEVEKALGNGVSKSQQRSLEEALYLIQFNAVEFPDP